MCDAPVRVYVEPAWEGVLHEAILNMPSKSVCAIDCLRVLKAAEVFLHTLTDVPRDEVIAAAVAQCEVFYFG